MGFPGGSDGEGSACNGEDLGSVPGWGNSLEKEMATHSCESQGCGGLRVKRVGGALVQVRK